MCINALERDLSVTGLTQLGELGVGGEDERELSCFAVYISISFKSFIMKMCLEISYVKEKIYESCMCIKV